MAKDLMYIDIGGALTTARAVRVSGDTIVSQGFAFCPSPLPSSDDLTLGVSPAMEGVRRRLARLGATLDPDEIVVTVSAGGEPRTVCAGVVRGISGESARRAALSAGATVSDLIAVDDGRQDFERVCDLKRQEISMVVLAGGVDEEILASGSHQLLNVAKVVAEGLPRRRGSAGKVPLIYAASLEGREEVSRIFGDATEIIWADNVRATLEHENLESARDAVASAFSRSASLDPRFSGLGRLGGPAIWPTGHAIGSAVRDLGARMGENIVVISLDGDAAQVFSSIRGIFTRTITPIERVDLAGVLGRLPSERLAAQAGEMLGNWKIHPYAVPRTHDELAVFLAFWKEALKLAMADHRESAIELRGVHRQRQISETFRVDVSGGDTLLRMERVGKVVLTGFLSRLLPANSLVSLVMDGAEPSGITGLFVDPADSLHIAGVLPKSGALPKVEGLLRPLAFLIGPGRGEDRIGSKRAFVTKGQTLEPLPLQPGEITSAPLGDEPGVELVLEAHGKADVGDGEGRKVRSAVQPGVPVVYLDGRPRGQVRPDRATQEVQRSYRSLKVFPDEVISGWAGGRD